MKKTGYIILSIVFILSFSACDQLPGFKKEAKQPLPVARSKGPVLARINSWILTVDEFSEQIDAIVNLNKGEKNVPVAMLGILAPTFMPYIESIDLASIEGKKAYLEFLINLELLAQEAEVRGLDRKPDIAKNIRARAVEVLDTALIIEILQDIRVTPLEIENFYNDEYKKMFEAIVQRKVREIVLSSESRARDILVQILQGADFASLASSHSVAESAKKGGDLGYLMLDPNTKFTKFWEVAFILDKGGVSSVFKEPGENKYYIIKVEDIKKGEVESLSKVYNQVEIILTQRRGLRAISDLIDRTKAKADMVINGDLIE